MIQVLRVLESTSESIRVPAEDQILAARGEVLGCRQVPRQ